MVFKNNRTDHCLRAAVSSIQSMGRQKFDNAAVCYRVLEHAAKLTESCYGIILKVKGLEQATPTFAFIAGTTTNRNVKNPGYEQFSFSEAYEKPCNPFWQKFLETNLASICAYPIDKEALHIFPSGHPDIQSALFISLSVRNQTDSIVCLANSASGYKASDIARLRPLWAAYELAMRRPDFLQMVSADPPVPLPSRDHDESISHYYARQFFSICYASLNGILTVDDNYCINSFNSSAERMFRIKAKDAIGRSLNYFIPIGADLAKSELDSSQGVKVWRHIKAVRGGTDEFFLDISAFRSHFGGRDQITFIAEDISDRIESARKFRENSQRFTAITNLAPVGIIQVNIDWSCIYSNEKMSELCGLSPEELSGQGWLSAIYEADSERITLQLRDSVANGKAFSEEFRLHTPLGKVTWVKANARALYDEHSRVMGMLATVTDISAQMEVESQLRELAEFDPLTGLVNRTFFNSHLQQAFDSSTRHGNVVLFFLDLDGFKQINDSLGHDIGDELLKQVAQRIANTVRKEDIVARLGGDEFTVILTHLKGDYLAIKVAQKIIAKMQAPFLINNQEIFVTASIGIATGNAANSDRASLLKQADIALYRAKALGRNNFQFFTPEMDAQARARMFLSNSLHRALNDSQFELYYQPQLGFGQGHGSQLRILGFEALLRWRHPEAGMITPDQFIPLLEETSLINDVSEWVLNRATRQMREWLDQGLIGDSIKMSVNISARQMYDKELPDKICRALAFNRLPAANLVIEITESSLMENSDANRATLSMLKERGIRISLDDFGTGYSSLSYLKRFPIDQLKIDRSFIADIIDDSDDAAIVTAIIAMAKSLKLETVAEGVDTANKLDFLRELSCDVYQGYFLSKPIPPNEIEAQFLTTHIPAQIQS